MSRILIIVTKGEIGGAQTVVATLARGLKETGFDVVVGYGAGTGSFLEEELKKSLIPVVSFKNLARSHNPFSFIAFIAELRTFLKKNRFDIVHFNSTNALFGAIAAKLVRPAPKTVFTFHGLSFLDPSHTGNIFAKIAYWLAFKFLLLFIDTPVCVSNPDMRYLQEINIIKKGAVVRNGATPHFLPKSDAIAAIERMTGTFPANAVLVGSIGRLAYPKNYEFFILAAKNLHAQFPALRFVIIGDGPERVMYEQLITASSLTNIFFLAGEIPHAETYLHALDIFTLTSLYEGAPMTLIEALHAGIPAVSPRIDSISDIMRNDTTQLYDSHNMQQYEEKLSALIADAALREKKGIENKHRSDKFSTAAMVEGYQKAYEN